MWDVVLMCLRLDNGLARASCLAWRRSSGGSIADKLRTDDVCTRRSPVTMSVAFRFRGTNESENSVTTNTIEVDGLSQDS